MSESTISQKLCDALRKMGSVVFKIHGHAMQQPGIPDFYLAHPLWQGWIETKGATTKLTPLQATFLRKLQVNGANAYVLRFLDSRRWRIETETDILRYFETKNWADGAAQLLQILNGLTTNGPRASTELSPHTK